MKAAQGLGSVPKNRAGHRLSAIVVFDVEPLKALHLEKDVGLIPSSLAVRASRDALLIGVQGNQQSEPAIPAWKGRLKIRLVRQLSGRQAEPNSIPYLLNALTVAHAVYASARRSRLLLVFHARPVFVLYALLYRLVNPHGAVWLKLDLDDVTLAHFLTRRRRFRLYLRCANIVTVESKPIQMRLNAAFGRIRHVEYVPDGYDSIGYPIDQGIFSRPRSNVVLTVGRLGSYQKNNECLLEAIRSLPPKIAEFRLIGESTEAFNSRIAHAQAVFPQEISRYERIDNRKELFQHYAEARVFVLTSRFESFGIVLVEAMAHGCYLISTELSSARDIIGNDVEVGLIVPQNDPKALAQAIKDALGRSINHRAIARKAERYYYATIMQNLSWLPATERGGR